MPQIIKKDVTEESFASTIILKTCSAYYNTLWKVLILTENTIDIAAVDVRF